MEKMRIAFTSAKSKADAEQKQNLLDPDQSTDTNHPGSKFWKWIPYRNDNPAQFIWKFSLATSMVHLLNAMLVFGLSLIPDDLRDQANKDLQNTLNTSDYFTDPYIPAICFNGIDANEVPTFLIQIDHVATGKRTYLLFLVVTFFMLSFIFQLIAAYNKEDFTERIKNNRVGFLRYYEYTLSASFMIVAIACTLQIYDIFTHILLFLCSALCMLLGLVADYIRTKEEFFENVDEKEQTGQFKQHCTELRELKWAAHYIGWVAITVPFVLLIWSFIRTLNQYGCSTKNETSNMPNYVYVIVFFQLFLFILFGMVQRSLFKGSENKEPLIGILTEFRYVVLSLLAKSMLGWVIFINVLLVV
jgi:hypothetical protein